MSERIVEAAWRVLDRIYIFGLAPSDAMADDLNALEAALGGRAARYATKNRDPETAKIAWCFETDEEGVP